MSAGTTSYAERQAAIEAEMATWPDIYQAVRDALAVGFVVDAYGAHNPPPYLLPPTKFSYPPGGLEFPHHASGPKAGARFGFWSFADGTPDGLREQRVWLGVQPSGYGPHLRPRSGAMTFDEAIAACLEVADYWRRHFIEPEWHGGFPELPVRDWRALLEFGTGDRAQDGQLELFAFDKPQTPTEQAQDAIRDLIADVDDDHRLTLFRHVYEVERLIDRANWSRVRWSGALRCHEVVS